MTYATLDDVKAELREQTFAAVHNRRVMQYLRTITQRVKRIAGDKMDFEPYLEQRKFTADMSTVNSLWNLFTLPGDYLLEITALSNDGTALVQDTDYYKYPRDTYRPIQALRLKEDTTQSWYPCYSSNVFDTILLTGWWGYKDRYSTEGWVSTGETVPVAGITDSAVSFTASDVDGLDSMGRAPRISAGNLLKIDSEVIEVTATDTSANTVTIRRAMRGTSAAAHVSGTTIYVWNVEDDIRYVVARAAAYSYSRIGAFNTTQAQDFTTVTYPADFPAQVRAAIQGYANG